MNFDFDDEEFERDVKIKVVGVGGGGGNAVENMVRNNVEGVDFIIINTDVAALKSKDGNTMERVQIGRKTTKGRGAGGKPPVAAESAKENSDDIAAYGRKVGRGNPHSKRKGSQGINGKGICDCRHTFYRRLVQQ